MDGIITWRWVSRKEEAVSEASASEEAKELAGKLVEEVLKSQVGALTLRTEHGEEVAIHCHKPALAAAAAAADDLKQGTGRPVI